MKSGHFLLLVVMAAFSSIVTAQPKVITYISPNGLQEECRILSQLPGADYDKGDQKDEQEWCGANFYDSTNVAICPKTWSTSPGTMIYDISKSGMSQTDYEIQKTCGGTKSGHEKITKFKQSMNQSGTSGTYSPSSLVYYHLSRFFDTAVGVPVAVYRSIDKQTHFDRVTYKAHSKGMGKGDKIKNGWKWLFDAEQNPSLYKPTVDLFTDDNRQIYGALSDGSGERYGEEINGVRSAWGDKQNQDFQQTPAFLALKSSKSLKEAIQEGLLLGQKNTKIKKAMGGGATDFQMAVWMKELSEIVILDYILSQQDRIGNIDFRWYYYWVDAQGEVKSKKLEDDKGKSVETMRVDMAKISYPKEVDGSPTQLIQRSRINDNDAGVRKGYTNYTKRTKMVEGMRHLARKTYERLLALNADLQGQGAIYQLLKAEYGITAEELQLIVINTQEVTSILQTLEQSGQLQLDLDSVKKMYKELK